MRTHKEVVEELVAAVEAMKANEYVTYEFRVDARCWATDERVARDDIRDAVDGGDYAIEWTGGWRIDVDRRWFPGRDLDEEEALSSGDVARIFPGGTVAHARREIRRRAASGDPVPLKVRGTWLAPLSWWRTVIDEEVGEGA